MLGNTVTHGSPLLLAFYVLHSLLPTHIISPELRIHAFFSSNLSAQLFVGGKGLSYTQLRLFLSLFVSVVVA